MNEEPANGKHRKQTKEVQNKSSFKLAFYAHKQSSQKILTSEATILAIKTNFFQKLQSFHVNLYQKDDDRMEKRRNETYFLVNSVQGINTKWKTFLSEVLKTILT